MSTPAQPSNSMPQSHARASAGEQSMGFFLGERGYFFVDGPSGAGGHSVTQSGFDGVAYNPETDHLIIYDNKSYARAGNVYGAGSIDPSKHLLQNLDRLINHVQTIQDLPEQAKILNLLRSSRVAVQIGAAWPPRVQIAVSNASGRSTGVGPGLAGRGIEFIDYYQAPSPSRRMYSNQDIMALAGQALGKLAMWLGDVAIRLDINRRLENMGGASSTFSRTAKVFSSSLFLTNGTTMTATRTASGIRPMSIFRRGRPNHPHRLNGRVSNAW